MKIRRKTIKAIKDKDFNKSIEKTKISFDSDDYKKELLLSKEREIFKDIYYKRLAEIEKMNQEVNYKILKHKVISSSEEFEFDESEDPFVFLNDIRMGKILIQEAKNIQEEYKKSLHLTRR